MKIKIKEDIKAQKMSGMDEYLSDLYKFRQKLERSDMNRNVVMNNRDVYDNETSPSSSEASASSSPDFQKRLLRLIYYFCKCFDVHPSVRKCCLID